jgi:hypothetical protein
MGPCINSSQCTFYDRKLVKVNQNVSKWFIKYEIPTKTGSSEEGWAVNWPRLSTKEVVGGGMSVHSLIVSICPSIYFDLSSTKVPKHNKIL